MVPPDGAGEGGEFREGGFGDVVVVGEEGAMVGEDAREVCWCVSRVAGERRREWRGSGGSESVHIVRDVLVNVFCEEVADCVGVHELHFVGPATSKCRFRPLRRWHNVSAY